MPSLYGCCMHTGCVYTEVALSPSLWHAIALIDVANGEVRACDKWLPLWVATQIMASITTQSTYERWTTSYLKLKHLWNETGPFNCWYLTCVHSQHTTGNTECWILPSWRYCMHILCNAQRSMHFSGFTYLYSEALRNGQRLLCRNFVRYILYHNSDENQYISSFE